MQHSWDLYTLQCSPMLPPRSPSAERKRLVFCSHWSSRPASSGLAVTFAWQESCVEYDIERLREKKQVFKLSNLQVVYPCPGIISPQRPRTTDFQTLNRAGIDKEVSRLRQTAHRTARGRLSIAGAGGDLKAHDNILEILFQAFRRPFRESGAFSRRLAKMRHLNRGS